MALILQLRRRIKLKTLANPSLHHLFSTTNSDDGEPQASAADQSSPNSKSSFSSDFSDVKERLQQRQPTASLPTTSPTFSFIAFDSSPPRPSKVDSLDEIRLKLSEFRSRSSYPPPGDPSSAPISFQELYKRNVLEKWGESPATSNLRSVNAGEKLSFDTIRDSFQHLRSSGSAQGDRKSVDRMSLSAFRDSLNLKPSDSTGSMIGGTNALPASVFGKEMMEKKEVKSSARSWERN